VKEHPDLTHRLSSLYEQIKKSKKARTTDDLAEKENHAEAGKHSMAFFKKTSRGVASRDDIPGFERLGDFTWHRQAVEKNPWQGMPPDFKLATTSTGPESLIFFDTETTGLSGVAGTMIFLLGLARIQNDMLFIDQYFLSDFPGENEFLSIIEPYLPDNSVYVSFNGKAFDSHLLFARFMLHGREKLLVHQYDLLFPSRRLWKNSIGSCTLKQIEAMVLGVPRHGDIDGADIPDCYFQFLRTGDTAGLQAIFHHNYLDVFSLAKIHVLLESMISSPSSLRSSGSVTDKAGLARILMALEPEKALELLKHEYTSGDIECGKLLGFFHKKNRAFIEAAEVWENLFEKSQDMTAGIELAKILEHKNRNYKAALEITETLITEIINNPQRKIARGRTPTFSRYFPETACNSLLVELNFRKDRLLAKLEKSGSR